MADMEVLRKNLEERGFQTSYFATAKEAADYLDAQIDKTTVGIGGSMTIQSMGLFDRLAQHNEVIWHWEGGELRRALVADVYLTSVNGLAETGEIVNIDGNCNRVAASMFGPKRVYYVVGCNKIVKDLAAAKERVEAIAAPANTVRLNCATPCAVSGKCEHCHSPARICCTTTIHSFQRVPGRIKVLLVGEPLGF